VNQSKNMKLQLLLSRVALLGAIATVAGAALGALALETFAAYVATLVLLTAAGDYARPPRPLAVRVAATRTERMPLAA
jgi:hypothetical protein